MNLVLLIVLLPLDDTKTNLLETPLPPALMQRATFLVSTRLPRLRSGCGTTRSFASDPSLALGLRTATSLSLFDCQGTVAGEPARKLFVELIGIEPTTSGLQSQRSPN